MVPRSEALTLRCESLLVALLKAETWSKRGKTTVRYTYETRRINSFA